MLSNTTANRKQLQEGSPAPTAKSGAACCLLDSSAEPAQQICIGACIVSSQTATDHREHPRVAPIDPSMQFSQNLADSRINPASLTVQLDTHSQVIRPCSRRACVVRPNIAHVHCILAPSASILAPLTQLVPFCSGKDPPLFNRRSLSSLFVFFVPASCSREKQSDCD